MDSQPRKPVAMLYDGLGGGTYIDWKEGWRNAPIEGYVWLHLDYSDNEVISWIENESGLNEIVAEALVEAETRPRYLLHDDNLLMILRGVNSYPGSDPEDLVSIRFWAEKNKIISTSRRNLRSINTMLSLLGNESHPKTPSDWLVELSERMTSRMEDVIEVLEDKVDDIQERIIENPSSCDISEIAILRRQSIVLRRYLVPQREALTRLSREQFPLINDDDRLRLKEVAGEITRFVEDIDASRDRAAVLQEELNHNTYAQINRRMYVLSILAALFLPLTFLTGLFGINVGGIPGAETSTGFFWVCTLLIGIGIVQALILKWRKWF